MDNDRPNLFERIFHRIGNAPESPEDIIDIVRGACEQEILDEDTAGILEKAIGFNQLDVRDVMITRSQMDVIKSDDSLEKIIEYVINTAHSRLPVIGNDRDDILGILHAKDLLRFYNRHEPFDLKKLLRPATFVPEGKSLSALLKEFRTQHIHLAMVVDEYGGISGLITFEDLLEAIFGEIEDEFDTADEEHFMVPIDGNRYRINALTPIDEFNEFFHTDFSNEEVDTIGGLVISHLGRLPERGEHIILDGWHFTVARVDRHRLHLLIVTPVSETSSEAEAS